MNEVMNDILCYKFVKINIKVNYTNVVTCTIMILKRKKELILLIIKNNSETVNVKYVCTRKDTLNFVFFSITITLKNP